MITLNDLQSFGKSDEALWKTEKSFTVEKVLNSKRDSCTFGIVSFYEGGEAPHVCFSLTVDGQTRPLYQSHFYIVGKSGEFIKQCWRIPPMFLKNMKFSVSFDIPDGTTLHIKELGESVINDITQTNTSLRYNAHLGFWGMAPDNTMPAFELAAMSGFTSCIAVPKVTKDGVIVCIHDDTINRTARDKDGNPPKESIYVCDKTYDELLEWEYGSYKNEIYKGTKIPKLTDFFDLCMKTGMSPMFSTHPGLSEERWHFVREELEKRGLLEGFHVKGFGVDILKTAYSVFGTDIEGYTHDSRDFDNKMLDDFIGLGIDKSKCRLGFEIPFRRYTKEIAEKITASGLFAAVYGIKQRTSEDYLRLISWGVMEFTEDLHCSTSFNW